MNKYTVIGLGLTAAAGVAVVLYFRNRTGVGQTPTVVYTGVVGSGTNATNGASYPFSNVGGAGATQSNQPWSNGPLRPNISTPGLDVNLSNINMLAEGIQSINSIVQSGSALYESFSGWFNDDYSTGSSYVLGQGYDLGYN